MPTGAAALAGTWLGVREEPVVAGGVWVPHSPAVPWWSAGWGSPCRLSPAQPLPGCCRWVRTCRTPASAPVPATWPRSPSSSRWVMLGRGMMLLRHRPQSLTAARRPPQGVDVIVNASSVEDIDPGAIGQRLSNGLARVSSPVLHRLRLREDENAEPVVMSPWQRWQQWQPWGIPLARGSCLPQPITLCAAYHYSPSLIPAPLPPLPLLCPRAPLTRKPTPPWR